MPRGLVPYALILLAIIWAGRVLPAIPPLALGLTRRLFQFGKLAIEDVVHALGAIRV